MGRKGSWSCPVALQGNLQTCDIGQWVIGGARRLELCAELGGIWSGYKSYGGSKEAMTWPLKHCSPNRLPKQSNSNLPWTYYVFVPKHNQALATVCNKLSCPAKRGIEINKMLVIVFGGQQSLPQQPDQMSTDESSQIHSSDLWIGITKSSGINPWWEKMSCMSKSFWIDKCQLFGILKHSDAVSYELIWQTLPLSAKGVLLSLKCIPSSKFSWPTSSYECWQVLYTSETQWQDLFTCVSFTKNICSNIPLEGVSGGLQSLSLDVMWSEMSLLKILH